MKFTFFQNKKSAFAIVLFLCLNSFSGFAQAEFTTWGNMTGIRVDNQLMEFNTSLAVINQWDNEWRTRREGQKIDFEREGNKRIFSYEMRKLKWMQSIESISKGKAEVAVSFTSPVDTLINGAHFSIDLTEGFGENTAFQILEPHNSKLRTIQPDFSKPKNSTSTKGIIIESPTRKLQIEFEKPAEIILEANDSLNPAIRLNVVLASGEIEANKIFQNKFNIKISGEVDKAPILLQVFPDQEGKIFDGIGGNFRLQSPNDKQVIDYNLKNLNVTWSRVEMPWLQWHPNRTEDPAAEARKGNLHPKVKAAMEMAQRLDKQGIPVMLAGWFAPNWAIIGERADGVNLDGSRGNALDLTLKDEIYASITSYVKYLKDEYGVEIVMFSFNESDLGIDVRQTPEEHNQLIKELGTHFRIAGLNTKFLLGDTADANGWEFTTIASLDPESQPFIGGVSFHSWRGYTKENLIKWADISNRVNEPLFVGEGSIDAGAWRYPEIFEEPTYALDEIDVYVKIMRYSQPRSILQWQLTSDYSVLSGGGVFGNDEEKLHPTQRFFNLKQLGSTSEGLRAIPVKINKEDVQVAALGDKSTGKYALHLVNKGATRKVQLHGLPATVKKLDLYITNQNSSFQKAETVQVKNGKAEFNLKGASFISLMTP